MFVVVAGQSNAVSWGTNGFIFPNWRKDDGIQIWSPSVGGFVTHVPGFTAGGVGTGASNPACWGVECQFAIDVRTVKPAETVYIYKHAINALGTAIKPAGVNDWSPYSVNKEFSRLMTNLPVAMTQAGTKQIDYLLWIGNESDALTLADSLTVQSTMFLFFESIRARMQSPGMVAIISQILPNTGLYPYADNVRAAQASMTMWPNNRVFDGGSKASVDASFHYDYAGVILLGHLFFMQAMQP